MELIKKKIGDIKPNDYNPNVMTPEQYEALKESIKRFDFILPILIDKEGVIIDGYHRWKACQELKKAEIECVIYSGKEDVEKYRKLITLAMNSIRGENDFDKFQEVLKDIVANIDTGTIAKLTAYDPKQIENLTADMDDYKRGMEGVDFNKIIDEFADNENKGKSDKNENWFYVEFYKDNKRYNELQNLLQSELLGHSKHQLNGETFYKMVTSYFGSRDTMKEEKKK